MPWLCAPVEAEEGVALRVQLGPVEARHGRVVAIPVVVAAPRLRILVPCAGPKTQPPDERAQQLRMAA